ncbi:MAG: phosphatidate cytidylyltransferase [Lachnospiraceae bacterium]|nr:phosphatidate cytidylyltransferase [Lachnospiraceae bacterium]
MFKTRLLSGIVLVILAIVFIGFGGPLLAAGIGFISLVGMFELYRVYGMERSVLAVFSYVFALAYYIALIWDFSPLQDHSAFFVCMIAAYLIFILAIYVFSYPKYKADQMMAVFFGFFYVALMLSYVYFTRMLPKGAYLVWLIFVCSWGCDTCAYCVGKLIGKHKMAPVLSPKKSVEGACGGVLGAMLLTLILGFAFQGKLEVRTSELLLLAGGAGIGGLISMVGDLAASAIKRNYDIKDYGTLIPGHGGVLDRFDSMIITAPIVYYLCVFALA